MLFALQRHGRREGRGVTKRPVPSLPLGGLQESVKLSKCAWFKDTYAHFFIYDYISSISVKIKFGSVAILNLCK